MRRLLSRLIPNEAGATSIEYALIAAGISIVIVGAVQALGVSVTGNFNAVLAGLESLRP